MEQEFIGSPCSRWYDAVPILRQKGRAPARERYDDSLLRSHEIQQVVLQQLLVDQGKGVLYVDLAAGLDPGATRGDLFLGEDSQPIVAVTDL